LEPRLQLSSALLLPVSVASLLRHIEIDVPFVGADKCQYDWLQQPEKRQENTVNVTVNERIKTPSKLQRIYTYW